MKFFYEAIDSTGVRVSGSLEAADEATAADVLERKGLVPVRVGSAPPAAGSKGKRVLKRGLFGVGTVGGKERILLLRQLATLLGASCPVDRAFDMMLQRAESEAGAILVQDMKAAVEGGATVSRALAAHPEVFSGMHVGMAAAGDEGGFLAAALDQVASYEETQARLRGQLVQAITYPAFMIAVMIVSCAVLFKFVVPSILEVVMQSDKVLPLPTRILVAISDGVQKYLTTGVLGSVVVGWGLWSWAGTAGGRRVVDRLRLVLPIVGDVTRKVVVSRVCRILAMLLGGGVNVVRALEIATGTAGNVHVETDLEVIRRKVTGGESLSACFEASDLFPPYVASMVQLGEETGTLDAMLGRLAAEYEEEYQTRLKGAVGLVEPMMIAVMGLVVGFVVVAIFLPMTEMSNAVGG